MKQVQIRITRKPRPEPEQQDAPTTDARITRIWFS